MEARFTKFVKEDNWVRGKVDKFDFEAKLFDEGSTFGIDDGRVSKLSIFDNVVRYQKMSFHQSCIVSYDRGWNIEAQEDAKPYYEAVMKLLNSAPKLF